MSISNTIGRALILFPLFMAFMLSCSYLGDRPIPAEILAREFEKDPSAAYKKYEGHYLVVTGVFEAVVKGEGGPAIISLKGVAGGSIMCSFEDASVQADDALLRLKYGQRILVKGHVPPTPQNLAIMRLHQCQLLESEDKA